MLAIFVMPCCYHAEMRNVTLDAEKRQRTAALQNLSECRSLPVFAKRLGVRQSSGAFDMAARESCAPK